MSERPAELAAAAAHAAAAQVRDECAQVVSLHHQAMLAAYAGQPTAEQDRNNGAGLAPLDRGPEPGTVVG